MRSVGLTMLLSCAGPSKDSDIDTSAIDVDQSDADSDADSDSDSDTDETSETGSPTEEPFCADASVEPMTRAEFLSLYRAKICWWWDEQCVLPGNCPQAPAQPAECSFDPVAACACLDSEWACDPVTGRPVGGPECRLVYDCPEDTAWVSETGESGDSGHSGDTGMP